MKRIISLIPFLVLIIISCIKPNVSYAAFPIQTTNEIEISEQSAISKTQQRFAKITHAPYNNNAAIEDRGTFGILSLCFGLVGMLIPSIPIALMLLIGAFMLGIFGVQPNRKLKGLAIAGLVMGSFAVLILLLAGTLLI